LVASVLMDDCAAHHISPLINVEAQVDYGIVNRKHVEHVEFAFEICAHVEVGDETRVGRSCLKEPPLKMPTINYKGVCHTDG